MQLKFYFGVAVAAMLLLPIHSIHAQSSTRNFAQPVIDSATQAVNGATSGNFFEPSFESTAGQFNSQPNFSSQAYNDDFAYGAAAPVGTDYVSRNAPSLIDLYQCGGRCPVKPPCKAVPNYGGNYCFGRDYGRPLFGRWNGF